MRLITWNCYRGDARKRAAELQPLSPDLIVLQEVSQPAEDGDDCVWFDGPNLLQGVAVFARHGYQLEPVPVPPRASRSVFPVVVTSPHRFHLLAVWAQRAPSYVDALNVGLTEHGDFLRAAPSIVVGDFNSHPSLDKKSTKRNHAGLVERLRTEFGLVSAYHESPVGVRPVEEVPTHFWQWREEQPFHIDYCFLPVAWAEKVREVHVGNFADWSERSDHRPLVIDVEP